MSKKRVTRLSQKNNNEKHENLLEFELNDEKANSQKIQENARQTDPIQNKSIIKVNKPKIRSQTEQFIPKSSQAQQIQDLQMTLSNIPSQSLNAKKKKISKKQQNEGIRIIQQKQTSRIFQHLCTPEGVITMESLGRVMVRAKKEFEVQDLENMIAYFDTIKKKMTLRQENPEMEMGRKGKKAKMQVDQGSQSIVSKRAPKKDIKQKQKLNRSFSSDDEDSRSSIGQRSLVSKSQSDQNFEDDLDQSIDHQNLQNMELNDEEDYKTQLNYEEFKLLKKYFDR